MPTFTIESTYRLPFSRKRTYDAATLEEACRLAMEDTDWSGQLANYECVGSTYVSGIWKGRDAAYEGKALDVPSQFDEMAHRMILHFHELLAQLACIAQPMGLPVSEFDLWLPRATAAVEKARAIIRERPDPDEPTAEPDEPTAEDAQELVRCEVGPCVTSLVFTLAQGFGEVQPGDRDTHALSVLAGQAYELAAPVPDYEQAATGAGWTRVGAPRGWQPAKLPEGYGGPFYKTAESLCHFEDLEPHEREVYEHWIVSDRLADKLISNGEKVDKDFAGLCVWARTRRDDVVADKVIVLIAQENAEK